jgi:glycine C-acetyltransferase
MNTVKFFDLLQKEVDRLKFGGLSKSDEKIIEGFKFHSVDSPRAIVNGKEYILFNSNDYLGLRFNKSVKEAESDNSMKFGSGPGAVRFISGTLAVHRELEKKLAEFHAREDAILFSSAFAANLATIFCLVKGQNKDSLVGGKVLVISDELNHRSIVDGIRLCNLDGEDKKIYKHLDFEDLKNILKENAGKYDRVLVVTDGVFSMLGEICDVEKLIQVTDQFQSFYDMGVLVLVDDCHGIGVIDQTDRKKADLLVGTLGKTFGADGGYVTGSLQVINYLREAAGTYIYSNSISAGTAGAAIKAITIAASDEGNKLIQKLNLNIGLFKKKAAEAGLVMAADSIHPIQPILLGDPEKAKKFQDDMWKKGIWVTSINYPVVAKGKDEIRIQISAAHSKADIELFFGTG